MKPPRNRSEKTELPGLCTYMHGNKPGYLQAGLPLTRPGVRTPGPLNPNTGTRTECCPEYRNPSLAPFVEQVCKHTLHVHIPTLPPKNTGWGPTPPARQPAQSLGRPSSVHETGTPLTQLTPGRSSDLELPVTYFPLLLFLEVLMSMQNSAERRARKKRESEDGKEWKRGAGAVHVR